MAHHKRVSLFKTPEHFISVTFRLAIGIFMILVAVKKLRDVGMFMDKMIINPDTLIAKEFPHFLLVTYGYALIALELLAGVLLVFDRYTKVAYSIVGGILLSFVFGQMYNGNTAKIGTEYAPLLLVTALGYYMHEKDLERK